jgi:hypothetical protein
MVDRVGVGLDLGLLLIKTGTRGHCDTTNSATGQVLTVAGWGLQLLAWAFALGSAVRRHTGVVAALMLQVSAAWVVGSGPAGAEV